jgi:hypothetical protein
MQDKSTEPKITSIEWERGDGVQSTLRVPTCDELLATTFEERRYLLHPLCVPKTSSLLIT